MCRNEVRTITISRKGETLQRAAHWEEKGIIYDVLQFCNEENKKKGAIILLERATGRAAEATVKIGRTVKNTHRDFANSQQSGGNVQRPGEFGVR